MKNYYSDFGSVKIIFNDSAARFGTEEYPTMIGYHTMIINEKDKDEFINAINKLTQPPV